MTSRLEALAHVGIHVIEVTCCTNSSLALTLSMYLSPSKATWELAWVVLLVQSLDLIRALKVNSKLIRLSFCQYTFIRRRIF